MAAVRKKRRRRRKIETSKIVLFSVLAICVLFEVVVLTGWLVFDRMDAAGLAGVFVAPMVTVTGFYLWKAKNENIQKYGFKADVDSDDEVY